jgi:membrane protein required for colicin V production
MTWVDFVVLGVLAISALLAFLRGFVREVLGIGAWVGAVMASVWAFPFARPRFREWLGTPDLVDPVTFGAVFIVVLIVLLLVSHWIGALVRRSVLGGLDRTLGLVFGLVRGLALVVVAYVVAGLVIPVDRWPDPVLQARTLPIAYEGAAWAMAQLPPEYRPRLSPPPPGRETTAAALLHAIPQGRATAKPFVRD